MPELPDVMIYVERLAARLIGQPLERIRLASPFLVRSVEPPLGAAQGKRLVEVRRLGKRIVWAVEDDLFLVFHLMIAGRLHWRSKGAKIPAKVGLAAFDFPAATVLLTEASSKKRATQSALVMRWTDRDARLQAGEAAAPAREYSRESAIALGQTSVLGDARGHDRRAGVVADQVGPVAHPLVQGAVQPEPVAQAEDVSLLT